MTERPWEPGDTPEEKAAREEAYRRLAAAASRAGMSIRTLHELLRQVADNEVKTREFLAREVYGVPDSLLDDMLRIRFADLARSDEAGDRADDG